MERFLVSGTKKRTKTKEAAMNPAQTEGEEEERGGRGQQEIRAVEEEEQF